MFSTLVITSPNMDFVPQYPVERQIVTTYTDGRWGVREYSRWPQVLLEHMWHVACIPRRPSPPHIPDVLWEDLSVHKHWRVDPALGVPGLGFVLSEIREKLVEAARRATERFNQVLDGPDESKDYGQYLLMTLSQAVDRMNKMPSAAQIAVVVAAHVQRLCLEAEGLLTYLEIVRPRLSGSAQYGHDVLPVLGAFVQDPTSAQTFYKLGLPVWLLQPMTIELKVWKIVSPEPLPFAWSRDHCNPPILHDTNVMAGVANLTHNWLRDAGMNLSKLACGSRLPMLAPAEIAAVLAATDPVPSAKRLKPADSSFKQTHITMQPVRAPVEQPNKKTRRHKRGKPTTEAGGGNPDMDHAHEQGSSVQPMAAAESGNAIIPPLPADAPPPSKVFMLSPFCSIPSHWARALKSVSPISRDGPPAVYFYPPPFLLDTVSIHAPPPTATSQEVTIRPDTKIVQYLHNLVRIRRFCRARLFDASMSNDPLTIVEWRAALFGEYKVLALKGPGTTPTAGKQSRSLRRAVERKAIGRLFGRVALMPSYAEDMTFRLDEDLVTRDMVKTDPGVRQRLLWESHEVNFRCEFMALDTVLVQRANWTELQRWQREREVSGVWGEPSSLLSVLPPETPPDITHIWGSEEISEWWKSISALCRFLRIITRWPECPTSLVDAVDEVSSWDESRFCELIDTSVLFYVQTFVQVFHRLPIPPSVPPTLRLTRAK